MKVSQSFIIQLFKPTKTIMPPSSVRIKFSCLASFRLEWDQKILISEKGLKEQEEPAQFMSV